MTATGLMNQTMVIYNRTSYGADGREVYDVGTTVRCRFQQKTKNVFSPKGLPNNGGLLTINGVAYVPATTTVSIDDKVTFSSENYKVYSKYSVPGRNGQTAYVKLELLKWQI
jgi:hypothetical protein